MAHIEDNTVDEAYSKLSWYRDWYQDAVKNTKSLQEQLNSEKECRCKVESELYHPQKEDKNKGKQREVSASREWCEWESASDSDIAEQQLSKTSRKQQQRDTGTPDIPYGRRIAFPDAEPKEMGPSTELLPIWSEPKAPDTMVPIVTTVPLSTLAPSLWGKGDPVE